MCEGKCINCQQIRNLDISKRLCEHCLQNTRVPFKRKRYESEISAKSGISALSAETQLTDIEDDDLECDGPSSDIDNDVTREQTDPKTIEFDLQSVGSLASHRYVYPIESAGQPLPRTCTSRTSLSSMSKTPNSRQIAQAQIKRRRQMRKNYSESDTGGFKQRPYIDRRYSADDENQIEELVSRDSIVLLNENFDNQPKVYVARAIKAVKSYPNVHRINPNAENLRINPNAESLYDSVNDDDSGYMQHQFVRRQSRQAVQEDRVGALNKDEELGKQTCCDNCLQRPARLKWTLAIVVFIAWAPVIALTVLLLGSVHGDPPPTEQPPIFGVMSVYAFCSFII